MLNQIHLNNEGSYSCPLRGEYGRLIFGGLEMQLLSVTGMSNPIFRRFGSYWPKWLSPRKSPVVALSARIFSGGPVVRGTGSAF